MGDQGAAASARCRRETIRAAVVTNVIATVNRRSDSPVTFFHHRTQKIARISSATQSWFAHSSRVKAALKSESAFLGGVVKCADDEIFAAVSLRTPRELFIFGSETLRNFRPRNVRPNHSHHGKQRRN